GRQVALEVVRDQVRDRLGVGIRVEAVALALEPRAQRGEVLDDAVQHHLEAAMVVRVGVRVALLDAAVRGPAGMADADRRRPGRAAVLAGHALAQRLEVADRTDLVERAVGQEGDARRVVAAVLEPLEAGEQELLRRAAAHVSGDSTHQSLTSSAADVRSSACFALKARRSIAAVLWQLL